MRIALGIEYEGTQYFGWQKQRALPSVQGALEVAIGKVADHEVETTCAGRTDAGVHALAQVVHFDTEAHRRPDSWLMGVNTHLPSDIRVIWACEVSQTFHARYSARARQYRYVIYNHHRPSALLHNRSMWVKTPLSTQLMTQAAQALIGEHDFSSFRGAGCQSKSAIRHVFGIDINQSGHLLEIDIVANAFLLHMVRNIVGSIIKVGSGEQPAAWLKELLFAKDRRQGGITAPACGLYLTGVQYPETLFNELHSYHRLFKE